MTNPQTQKQAVQIMADAFKRSLIEHIGQISEKPPMELVAWSKALISLEQEIRLELLRDVELPG